jgi:phenylacetate-CoA ligase
MSTNETRRSDSAEAGQYWDPAVETMDRDALRILQLGRLHRQLRRCFDESELYRTKFNEIGVEPADVTSLDAISQLPFVTKEELRLDQMTRPPYGSFTVAPAESWRELHPSSGTTGTPLHTIWSAQDIETITDFTARTLWQAGVRAGDVVQNAFAYGLWVAGLSVHYAANRIGALVVPIGTGVSTQKQLDYLRAAGSTILLSTPSYALHIGEEFARTGGEVNELALRIGCFGGEAGSENPATRSMIERALGIRAFDYYGLAEIGPTFAGECTAQAGLHFAEDHVLVECVDPATHKPVADHEIGVLVFTHLTREASPMIRYWSNDYARLSRERCVCGRTHLRAVGGILGRADDLIVFKGAKFYPAQVENVVRSFAQLSPEFRIEIERGADDKPVRSCTLVVEWVAGPVDGLEEAIVSRLRGALGVTPALRVEPSGTLERTAFKAVRLVRIGE